MNNWLTVVINNIVPVLRLSCIRLFMWLRQAFNKQYVTRWSWNEHNSLRAQSTRLLLWYLDSCIYRPGGRYDCIEYQKTSESSSMTPTLPRLAVLARQDWVILDYLIHLLNSEIRYRNAISRYTTYKFEKAKALKGITVGRDGVPCYTIQ